MAEDKKPKARDMDEPVKIDLDPEVALRALLKVEPEPEDSTRKQTPKPRALKPGALPKLPG
jgi:hypothetical protein